MNKLILFIMLWAPLSAAEQSTTDFCNAISTWVVPIVFERQGFHLTGNEFSKEQVIINLQHKNNLEFNSREAKYIDVIIDVVWELPIEELFPTNKEYVANVAYVVGTAREACIKKETE